MSLTPFVTLLQCLRCGTGWWSGLENRRSCPKCEPNGPGKRIVLADGTVLTEYVVARVVAP